MTHLERTRRVNTASTGAPRRLSRRLFMGGLVTAAWGAGAWVLGQRYGFVPPDHGGILGVGHTLTYAAHRGLLSSQPLAREFPRSAISTNFPAINTTMPEGKAYRDDMAAGFRAWRLTVDGLVARPREFSLEDLQRFPSRTQVTMHVCEQGW